MRKAWRVVIIIILIAILLGTVSVGVGLLTGAEMTRIFSVVNEKYNIQLYYNWLTTDVFAWVRAVIGI